jgi:signal transduction histidine kinase
MPDILGLRHMMAFAGAHSRMLISTRVSGVLTFSFGPIHATSFDTCDTSERSLPSSLMLNLTGVGSISFGLLEFLLPAPHGIRGLRVSNISLRTKFLLSLVAISASLTVATLLIVSYSVRKRIRENIREDLRNSVFSYQSFQAQQEESLTRSAVLVANLPNVRALMSTEDAATIEDASADVWKLSGSDLLVLANRTGKVVALRASVPGLDPGMAQGLLQQSIERSESRGWWFGGGHLYEVWIQQINFGAPPRNITVGLLAVGHEINAGTAGEFASVASGDVAFNFDGAPVASTLSPALQADLSRQSRANRGRLFGDASEIQLGSEHYIAKTVNLSPAGGPLVSLTVLKSFDKATSFLGELDHVLIGLGLFSVLAGSTLVLWISHTYTKPLANLVAGVRALGQGDFSYPLDARQGDEVAEVTDAFVRVRASLASTQEEQRQLEERLRQAHKMEAVGRLAGGVAHDFNNLLTIIRGNSDLLKDREGADAFHQKCVDQIQKASGRAVSMTRQLLAFSRMQVLQPRVMDLNGVVAEMGKMLPRLIGEHIEYSFSPDPKLASVKADPGQIEQVILNLAVNARDAMPSGGKLSVLTKNILVDDVQAAKRPPMIPGRYILLSVRDTGHGMDEATKAHIFEPFFTTKEIGKGTGLGLATVYGVVKQSGGFIWVDSSLGKGTTFEVYLPQVAGKQAIAEPEEKPPAVPGGSETVLIVEDEAGVRELACQFLRVKGYNVLEAESGLDALDVAQRHPGTIHLLLSDMVMPKMNGGDLAARLKAIRPEIRIAFMSGYSEFSRGDMSKGFPEAPVLQKPFSPASLVEIVREALARPLAATVQEGSELQVT